MIFAIPYILFFCTLYIFSFFNTKKCVMINKKSNGITVNDFFIFFICLVFIGCRTYVYTDWISYKHVYEKAPILFYSTKQDFIRFFAVWSGVFEVGFLAYNILIKTIIDNYLIFQLISFLFDYILLVSFLNYYFNSKNYVAIFFFVLFGGILIEFNLLRNSKALLLFAFASRYIIEHKPIKYFIIILIAVLFHTSALIYIPLYFFINKKWNMKLIYLFFIFGNMLYILRIDIISSIITALLSIYNNDFTNKLMDYFATGESFSMFSLGYIERLISFIFVLKNYKYLRSYKFGNFIINSYCLYGFSYLFLFNNMLLAERISILFIYSYWLLYPVLIKKLKKTDIILSMFLIFLYGNMKLFVGNTRPVCEYQNFLYTGLNVQPKM